jgi:hypothetical protein
VRLVSDFKFNEAALNTLLSTPTGAFNEFLNRVGQRLQQIAQDTLSRPYPGGLNPPPGPPYLRSGDLRASVTYQIVTDSSGPTVYVTASSVHRGADYARILQDRNYTFVVLPEGGITI